MGTDAARHLLARAVAYGACAKLLGPASQGAVCGESVLRLQKSLEQLELEDGLRHLQAFREEVETDPDGYRAEYLRVFERGAVPPYEASSGPNPLAGPNVMQIADVAGFYRAFGFEARGERPDHLAAELEFLALLCLLEARALLGGLREEAQVCAEARRSFLQDHLLSWLPSLQENVDRITSSPALRHLLGLTARLVQTDAVASAS